MDRKPYETKRESNRETKREEDMCETKKERNRKTKRENYTVYKYIYIYCDVTNVDSFLKKSYINPKGTTHRPVQYSSVQCSTVKFVKGRVQ